MRVVFLHVRQDPRYAEVMIRSGKRFGYHFTQLTDKETPKVPSADEVIRIPWEGRGVMAYKLKHLMLLRGEYMAVDTDIVFQRDVSDVMQKDFEVCLTRRKGPIIDVDTGIDVAIEMPYNGGVLWAKDHKFFFEAHRLAKGFAPKGQDWYGDQVAYKMVADQKRTKILELECGEYNYTPSRLSEDVSSRAIVHYKGGRKEWMLRWQPSATAITPASEPL